MIPEQVTKISSRPIHPQSNSFEGFAGFKYQYPLSGSSERGWGQLLLISPADREEYRNIQSAIVELTLSQSETVAAIDEFYPNGREPGTVSAHWRQGRGTKLLQRMMQDAKSAGTEKMLCWSAHNDMREFLVSKGFSKLEESGYYVKSI